MSSDFIYTELTKYALNELYLKRYIKYINLAIKMNPLKFKDSYMEKHHILPYNLFPEFDNFSQNPFNLAVLTAKQHLIAHWLLWKALGHTQFLGYWSMCARSNSKQLRYPIRQSKIYENAKRELSAYMREHNPFKLAYLENPEKYKNKRRITHIETDKEYKIDAEELDDYLNNGYRLGTSSSSKISYSICNSKERNPAYGRTAELHPLFNKVRGISLLTKEHVITSRDEIFNPYIISDISRYYYKFIFKNSNKIYFISSRLEIYQHFCENILKVTERTFRNILNHKNHPKYLIEKIDYILYSGETMYDPSQYPEL